MFKYKNITNFRFLTMESPLNTMRNKITVKLKNAQFSYVDQFAFVYL